MLHFKTVVTSLVITWWFNSLASQDECTNIEEFRDENGIYYKEICKSSSCRDSNTTNMEYPYIVLPRIDLQKYKQGNNEEKIQILNSFDTYLSIYGTLSIYNHGIDTKLLDEVWKKGKQFFDSPLSTKLSYKIATGNSGYDIYKFVSAARTEGIPTQPMDLTESFSRYKHDSSIQDRYGPNNCPEYFLNITNIYIDKIVDILHIIHEIAALSLGLEMNYFNDKYDNESAGHFRYYHFPALNLSNVNEKQMRLSEHRDYLGFNSFINENIRGLQMKIDGIWIDCKAKSKYDIILNTGQLFEIWTNKHWKANIHRVIPYSERRLTLAYFSSPSYDTLISPIKECKVCMKEKNQQLFEPRTVKQHETMLFEQSMSELSY